eukprot:scaffold15675_cov84-Isochrysis_galbana.AAC.1
MPLTCGAAAPAVPGRLPATRRWDPVVRPVVCWATPPGAAPPGTAPPDPAPTTARLASSDRMAPSRCSMPRSASSSCTPAAAHAACSREFSRRTSSVEWPRVALGEGPAGAPACGAAPPAATSRACLRRCRRWSAVASAR